MITLSWFFFCAPCHSPHISVPVHITLEKFEKGVFTPKMNQMFSGHTTPQKFKNAKITCGGKAQDLIVSSSVCF